MITGNMEKELDIIGDVLDEIWDTHIEPSRVNEVVTEIGNCITGIRDDIFTIEWMINDVWRTKTSSTAIAGGMNISSLSLDSKLELIKQLIEDGTK